MDQSDDLFVDDGQGCLVVFSTNALLQRIFYDVM